MDNKFYVYVWYDNGVPVYVGKGCGKRAFRTKEYVVDVVADKLSEQEAFDLERKLISEYGRKDTGDGTLLNLTDGGGIAFSTLYWEGDELQKRHRRGVSARGDIDGWYDKAVERARHAARIRADDWQDSLYLIKEPSGQFLELKTQELKLYCEANNLKFDQMKHIARTGPVKRKIHAGKVSLHYGYYVGFLYNKVTKEQNTKEELIKSWQ